MQWLIDMVIAAIGIPPCFVKRGTRAFPGIDFNVWVQNGAWHDLDVSAIVPANATCFLAHLKGSSGAVGGYIRFRPKGDLSAAYSCRLRPQLAGVEIATNIVVGIDSNRVCQYYVGPPNFAGLTLAILGWWF